jgi:hypothetical protein
MQRIKASGTVMICVVGSVAAGVAQQAYAQSETSTQAPTPPQAQAAASAPAAEAPRIVYVVRAHRPAFRDKTAGGTVLTAGLSGFGGVAEAAALGAAHGAVSAASGSASASKDELQDPANMIGAKVAALVGPNLGAVPADKPVVFEEAKLTGSANEKAAQLAGGARYLVNVQTELVGTVWASYATWPLDFTHYIVEYMGHITIHDVQAGKPVFSGRCQVFSKRGPDLPTHAEMYADDGARLKVYLAEAVDDCVAQLQAKNSEFQALTQPHGAPN